MSTNTQPVEKPKLYARSHPIDNSGTIATTMTALQIIAYVQTINPQAKLIPNTKTYNAAVKEYNFGVKNSIIRPEVPEWFCGNVSSRGELVETAGIPAGAGSLINAGVVGGRNIDESGLSEYPMDGCVLSGGTPASPGYVNCLGSWNVDRDLGKIDFWSDFVVEYSAGILNGEGGPGCIDTAGNAPCNGNSGGVCWAYCSVGANSKETGDYKLTVSGLSTDGFSCNTGTKNFNKWGGGDAIIAAFFMINGQWRGGKFEWIRPSTTSRSFGNIKTGYCGWDCTAPDKSRSMKACMVSADGSKRTKLVTASR